MNYIIQFISDAEQDLYEIYQYISKHDSPQNAEQLLIKIEEACKSLTTFPNCGHIPHEFQIIGHTRFLQFFYKPYRIIYEVSEQNVFVHAILDGRRELHNLLHDRLLR